MDGPTNTLFGATFDEIKLWHFVLFRISMAESEIARRDKINW